MGPREVAARAYLDLGYRVVPVPLRGKNPGAACGEGWQQLVVTTDTVEQYFGTPGNIGVMVGAASGDLADVDLDTPEAVELAPIFLPKTWTFGRESKRRSHWLYVLAGSPPCQRFIDPLDRATLLELRTGTGLQTVFPPSVHESGEDVEWSEDADAMETPRHLEVEALRTLVTLLAVTVLLKRNATPEAFASWLEGGPAPEVHPAVARRWREWMGLPTTKAPPPRPRTAEEVSDFAEAARSYNVDHARELPRNHGTCPVCGDRDCFGSLPKARDRWACFSTSHIGAGIAGKDCTTGDVLDLDAFAAGISRAEVLRRDGYLAS